VVFGGLVSGETVMVRFRAYGLLLLLALVFFIDLVLHPTQVLYSDHSDILALHLPDKIFLCHSFHQTGELPLWCPYRFAGVPFIHDFQVGAFYPPHWLLLVLPEQHIGAGMSWLVVFHIVVAGWTMYAYGRFRGLADLGALVAAIGYMFSGKLLLHVLAGGHFNMLMIAWLPLAVMLFEMALAQAAQGKWFATLTRATWAGVVFSLIVLTAYPYVTLYAGLFLAMWTLGALFYGSPLPRIRGLASWVVLGCCAMVVAGALAAVQLLPAMEAAKLATRSGAVTNPFSESLWPLMFLAGPSLIREPATLAWEVRGGFGVLWLAVAALAPVLCRGRVRFEAAVCVLFVLLALGGIAVLYWVPGVAMFRLPSRIFLLATFPVAFLAGTATDVLSRSATALELVRCRSVFVRVVAVVLFFVAAAFVLALLGKNARWHIYWAVLPITVTALWYLLSRWQNPVKQGAKVPRSPIWMQAIWCVCLLADLWAIAWPEVQVRTMDEIYPVSPAVAYLAGHSDGGRVLDLDQHAAVENGQERVASVGLVAPPQHSSVPMCSPLGYGAPLALQMQIEPVRGFNPMDVERYKEYLQFLTDQDGPIRPLDEKCPFGFPSIGNFRPINWSLADLLGVRYLLVGEGEQAIAGQRWTPVLEDARPRAFTIAEGGVVALQPFTLYQSATALPRAFVVGEAERLPDGPGLLESLRTTDFRKTVLLENNMAASNEDGYREASVVESRPNHVRIDVPEGPAGYLVLADVWYPGWHARVDGQEVPCLRADYLFRAVVLGEGAHQVEFTFWPESYARGRSISAAAVLLVLMSLVLALLFKMVRTRANV
jgi:hypothetical protein